MPKRKSALWSACQGEECGWVLFSVIFKGGKVVQITLPMGSVRNFVEATGASLALLV